MRTLALILALAILAACAAPSDTQANESTNLSVYEPDKNTTNKTINNTQNTTSSERVETTVTIRRPPQIECPKNITIEAGERFLVYDHCEFLYGFQDHLVVYYSGSPGVSRFTPSAEDEGLHTLIMTASDGNFSDRAELDIYVTVTIQPPVFPEDFAYEVSGREGETITIDMSGVEAPSGTDLEFEFEEPFSDEGAWHTERGDAGTYDVDVTATTGDKSTTRTVRVTVAAQELIVAPIDDITVYEGERVEIPLEVEDRDEDEYSTLVSGWMSSLERETTYGDAGEHHVTVSVNDGDQHVEHNLTITVLPTNRAPSWTGPE